MNPSTTIRGKIITALSGLTYYRRQIPIFDEIVNPTTPIPQVGGAEEVYIVIQDEQNSPAAVQHCCAERRTIDVTIRVVTKWGLTGSKKLCEDIGYKVDKLLRDGRTASKLDGVQKVNLAVNRTISEVGEFGTAFSNILIYEITFNLE